MKQSSCMYSCIPQRMEHLSLQCNKFKILEFVGFLNFFSFPLDFVCLYNIHSLVRLFCKTLPVGQFEMKILIKLCKLYLMASRNEICDSIADLDCGLRIEIIKPEEGK